MDKLSESDERTEKLTVVSRAICNLSHGRLASIRGTAALMTLDIESFVISAQARLERAREIAAAFRHDRDVHKPLMHAVFALEDVLFALHETAAKSRKAEQNPAR